MAKPVALIMAFSKKALPKILHEIAAGPQPPRADWFVGTYGINKKASKLVRDVPGCRYAPVFGIQPHTSEQARKRRPVPNDVADQLDPTRAGEIPGGGDVLPPSDRRAWGIELGRRFRDQMRTATDKGVHIDTWQFDEILGECGSSEAHRQFVGGVLRGLMDGRPVLGDRKEQGFVWTARTALTGLPGLSLTAEVQKFWEDLDKSSLFLVGEEYPVFRDDPAGAASVFSSGHRAFAGGGAAARRLAQRYVVGMSPGWRPVETGLGGNLDHKPLAFVTQWRRGFIEARVDEARPRGFGHYNFVFGNARGPRIKDAVEALHHAGELI